jgi:mRNA-degrading endonuclease RelE of RelBE toxin-antitoxin system
MGLADARRLRAALQQVADDHPRRQSFVTEMVWMRDIWRARKGDFRAVFTVEGTTLRVISVGNRKDIYR